MDGNEASYHSGVTTTVAVAAASVTIVVVSIFCFGFIRRPKSHDPSIRHRNRSLRKPIQRTIVSGSQLGVPMRRHFVRLEDLSASPTSFGVTASISPHSFPNTNGKEDIQEHPPRYSTETYYHEVNCDPNINWSVSDITSDSASLRSGVSRTPSMLERIEEEIEDEEEELKEEIGSNSCNFSYSEDSTIISNILSKSALVSLDDCDNNSDNHSQSTTYENTLHSNCASKKEDRVLDNSDFDPCFPILPDNSEDIFFALEDLSSSNGTQESLLESIVLETRMSAELSDSDSFKTAQSDASMISLVSLVESTLLNDVKENPQESAFKDVHSKHLRGSTLKPIISKLQDNTFVNRLELDSEQDNEDKNDFVSTTTSETTSCVASLTEDVEEKDQTTFVPTLNLQSAEVDEEASDDDNLSVTYSIEGVLASEKELIMDDVASLLNSSSSILFNDCEMQVDPTSYLGDDDPSSTDTDITTDSVESEDIKSMSQITITNDEAKQNMSSSSRMDDDMNTVESFDEWLSELMDEEPKQNTGTPLTRT